MSAPIPADPRIAQYAPLVRAKARSYWRSINRYVDLEDLESVGMTALWQATQHWTPEGGASFGTYARTVVGYAMLGQKRHWRSTRRNGFTESLTGHDGPDDDCGHQIDLESDLPSPNEVFWASETSAAIHVALNALPERLRDVIVRRFWWDQTLQEVGDSLGVSRERARQLEAQALAELMPRLVFVKPGGVMDPELKESA